MKHTYHRHSIIVAAAVALAACGGSDSGTKTDAQYGAEIVDNMHTSIGAEIANMVTAATALQAAAPTHAWNATTDATAIAAMIAAWRNTRVAYEHIEGATASIYPDIDVSTDARYDDFLAMLGPTGDQYLFDDVGVTGMHAIERILFAPSIRPEVIAFESGLPGYKAAAFPETDQEAMDFKNKLAQKLVNDSSTFHAEWVMNPIDLGVAFQGLVGLMNEQKEKVNLAATGAEESRYANTTLFDLRNNLDGTKTIYALFQPWIQSKPSGVGPDSQIEMKFTALAALYNTDPGDDLPPVPADWSSDTPSSADLATPFGSLWEAVHQDVDPNMTGSVVFEMNNIATLLGFPQFTEMP